MTQEALKLALEALKEAQTNDDGMEKWDRNKKAITAIKAALAQPAHRIWVGLTDEEIETWNIVGHESLREFVRAIEAKLKEKNYG